MMSRHVPNEFTVRPAQPQGVLVITAASLLTSHGKRKRNEYGVSHDIMLVRHLLGLAGSAHHQTTCHIITRNKPLRAHEQLSPVFRGFAHGYMGFPAAAVRIVYASGVSDERYLETFGCESRQPALRCVVHSEPRTLANWSWLLTEVTGKGLKHQPIHLRDLEPHCSLSRMPRGKTTRLLIARPAVYGFNWRVRGFVLPMEQPAGIPGPDAPVSGQPVTSNPAEE